MNFSDYATRTHGPLQLPFRGGSVCLGGCLPRVGCLPREGCLPRVCLPKGAVCPEGCTPCRLQAWIHPLLVNRITDRCKNITFPQLRLRELMNFKIHVPILTLCEKINWNTYLLTVSKHVIHADTVWVNRVKGNVTYQRKYRYPLLVMS